MKFKLYRKYGAMNSGPVFDAFELGLKKLGHTIVDTGEDVVVIWSVLWHGRMFSNKAVYEQCQKNNVPVMIIEIGNLVRGTTWRISLDNINGLGQFGNCNDLDPNRPKKLNIQLKPETNLRRKEILIASQHEKSLQWIGQPAMSTWVKNTVAEIKKYTDRLIVIRPHPRSPIVINAPGVLVQYPKLINNTYDDFDIDYNYHCVVNFNSGPAVKAAINGIPVICDATSLAGELSNKFENIENPVVPNREEWFTKLCHTEWLLPEIIDGIPQKRLIDFLQKS
jgi:hypothetical protein